MKYMFLRGLVCWLFAAIAVCPVWAVTEYEVVDLGEGFTPVALNDTGMAVLLRETWEDDFMSELYVWDGQQSNFLFKSADSFQLSNINDNGNIISCFHRHGLEPNVSYYWKSGNLEVSKTGVFRDINNHEQILYRILPNDYFDESYLREPDGSLVDIGNVDGRILYGVALNEMGQITGITNNFSDGEKFEGFVWDDTQGFSLFSPLAGDDYSCGMDINNKGQVVGYSQDWESDISLNPDRHLIFWDPVDGVTDIGSTIIDGGISVYLNDSSQIAGEFKLNGDDEFKSYLWQEDMGYVLIQDLLGITSGWEVNRVWGLNNNGEMIASARIDGESHALLLRPVPEPGTLLLMSLGILIKRRIVGNR